MAARAADVASLSSNMGACLSIVDGQGWPHTPLRENPSPKAPLTWRYSDYTCIFGGTHAKKDPAPWEPGLIYSEIELKTILSSPLPLLPVSLL